MYIYIHVHIHTPVLPPNKRLRPKEQALAIAKCLARSTLSSSNTHGSVTIRIERFLISNSNPTVCKETARLHRCPTTPYPMFCRPALARPSRLTFAYHAFTFRSALQKPNLNALAWKKKKKEEPLLNTTHCFSFTGKQKEFYAKQQRMAHSVIFFTERRKKKKNCRKPPQRRDYVRVPLGVVH